MSRLSQSKYWAAQGGSDFQGYRQTRAEKRLGDLQPTDPQHLLDFQ